MRVPNAMFVVLCLGVGIGVGGHFGPWLGGAAFCATTLAWLFQAIGWTELPTKSSTQSETINPLDGGVHLS